MEFFRGLLIGLVISFAAWAAIAVVVVKLWPSNAESAPQQAPSSHARLVA